MTDNPNDLTTNLWSLARLTFPEQRPYDIGSPLASLQHHVSLEPDDHLLCFDDLYYTAVAPQVRVFSYTQYKTPLTPSQASHEIEHDYSPVWRDVARHLRWTGEIQSLAEGCVKDILGLPQQSSIPHVRRFPTDSPKGELEVLMSVSISVGSIS